MHLNQSVLWYANQNLIIPAKRYVKIRSIGNSMAMKTYITQVVYTKSTVVSFITQADNADEAIEKSAQGYYLTAVKHIETDSNAVLGSAREIPDTDIDYYIAQAENQYVKSID